MRSLDFTADDYQELQLKLLNAAQKMQSDGWWLNEQEHPERDKRMRKRLMWEMVGSLVKVPKALKSFYLRVMVLKND